MSTGALRAATHARHYEQAADMVEADGTASWITRARNFAVVASNVKPGAVLASELANPIPGRHYSAEFWHFTFDHELNGVMDAQGEDDDARWRLVVTGNTVTSVRAD